MSKNIAVGQFWRYKTRVGKGEENSFVWIGKIEPMEGRDNIVHASLIGINVSMILPTGLTHCQYMAHTPIEQKAFENSITEQFEPTDTDFVGGSSRDTIQELFESAVIDFDTKYDRAFIEPLNEVVDMMESTLNKKREVSNASVGLEFLERGHNG